MRLVRGMNVLAGNSASRLPSRFKVSNNVTLWKTLFDIREMRLFEISSQVKAVTSSKLESLNSVSKFPEISNFFRLKSYFMAFPGTRLKWFDPK